MSNEQQLLANDVHQAATRTADGAILAALISIQIKDAKDKDEAAQRMRLWIHSAFDTLHADPVIPHDVKNAIRNRIDSVFDNVSKLRAD
ncbi:hypothetical protein [Burkholderia sp. AU32262]|uniref:hypothetical protein n=1 Tax=Burkholderia sp. AU32262 TaxID=2879630 RepID=UPI001CF5E318|nr:hypothetical protein [Burkholderia sp. AU32262]MCA8242846.1 hypothetical protein [Burkholderia sp. AU32262]